MCGSKVMVNYRLRQKSKMAAKKSAKKVAKTRPWDNISRWEHTNSLTGLQKCKLEKYIIGVHGNLILLLDYMRMSKCDPALGRLFHLANTVLT